MINHKNSKTKASVIKYAAAVTAGTIMTTTVITCSTHSYFKSTALAEGNITTAASGDLIECKFETVKALEGCKTSTEDIRMDFGSPDSKIINPDKIKISNRTGKKNINIYFAFDDSISNYIRPVNPIEICDTDGEKEVSINVDISIEQFLRLLKDLEYRKSKQESQGKIDPKEDVIDGCVTIKYLNNYINKTQKIGFTKDYLMTKFLQGLQEDLNSRAELDASYNNGKNDGALIQLAAEEEQLINYISPQLLPEMHGLMDEEKSLKQIVEELNERINSMEAQSVSVPSEGVAIPEASVPGAAVDPQTSNSDEDENPKINPPPDTAINTEPAGENPESQSTVPDDSEASTSEAEKTDLEK